MRETSALQAHPPTQPRPHIKLQPLISRRLKSLVQTRSSSGGLRIRFQPHSHWGGLSWRMKHTVAGLGVGFLQSAAWHMEPETLFTIAPCVSVSARQTLRNWSISISKTSAFNLVGERLESGSKGCRDTFDFHTRASGGVWLPLNTPFYPQWYSRIHVRIPTRIACHMGGNGKGIDSQNLLGPIETMTLKWMHIGSSTVNKLNSECVDLWTISVILFCLLQRTLGE